jgi:hypothetical protein
MRGCLFKRIRGGTASYSGRPGASPTKERHSTRSGMVGADRIRYLLPYHFKLTNRGLDVGVWQKVTARNQAVLLHPTFRSRGDAAAEGACCDMPLMQSPYNTLLDSVALLPILSPDSSYLTPRYLTVW